MDHTCDRLEPVMFGYLESRMVVDARTSTSYAPQPDQTVWGDLHNAAHIVQFYQSDAFLAESAGAFLGAALRAGGVAVVIATETHRRAFEERLLADGVHLGAAREGGRYIALDAAAILSHIVASAMPDPRQFDRTFGPLLSEAAAGGRIVHVFGEVVALLVQDGNSAAALALETLWNDLQRRASFSLLCAYPMPSLQRAAPDDTFGRVCEQHARVLPTERYLALQTPDERLRAVAELQQQAQRIETALAELRQAEEAARGERDAVRRVRDEFLAIAAHELRNPLAGLSLHAQLALRRLTRDGHLDPSWGTQALQAITGQASKLTNLLDRLLDVSRLETGAIALDLHQIDLATLVAQVVADARAWSPRHTVRVAAPPSLPARLDPLRLEQVLANVLHTAIKSTPAGETIDVILSQPLPDRIELVVRDTGPGMPAAAREAIFERCVPADAGDPQHDLGLGLYLSRQIVELHGGTLELEPHATAETRFVIRLPSDNGYQ